MLRYWNVSADSFVHRQNIIAPPSTVSTMAVVTAKATAGRRRAAGLWAPGRESIQVSRRIGARSRDRATGFERGAAEAANVDGSCAGAPRWWFAGWLGYGRPEGLGC
ncbi:hypothetical protein GCM10023063_24790 [Arthrobacter methylotrophus]